MQLSLPPSVQKSAAYSPQSSSYINSSTKQLRTSPFIHNPENGCRPTRARAAQELQGHAQNEESTSQSTAAQLNQPLARPSQSAAQTYEQARRPAANRISGSNLSGQIKDCKEWQHLVRFYSQHPAQLNALNMLAFINAFAKVDRNKKMTRFEDARDQAFVSSVIADLLTEQHLPHLTIRGLANVLWALGKLGMSPGLVSLNTIQDILLRQLADETQCDPVSLSQIIWGMAKLGYNPGNQFLSTYLAVVERELLFIEPQGQSNILWALASLKVSSSQLHSFLELYINTSVDILPLYSPQGLANTYWALAELGYYPGETWLQACWQAGELADNLFNVLDVSQMLKAAAKFKSKAAPSPKWIAALLPCCLRSRFPLGPTEFVTTLFSLASLGYEPPDTWSRSFLDKGHGSLKHLSAQEASNLVWALARLNFRTRRSFQRDWFKGSFNCLPYMNTQDYAHVVCSLGYLQWEIPDTWLAALQEGLFKQLPFLEPSHMALLANGWARIGCKPTDVWLERFYLETAQLSESSSNQELCATLYWLAKGRLRPPQAWLTAWMKASSGRLRSFNGQELANCICALRWTQATVTSSWMDSYVLAVHAAAQRQLQRQFPKVLDRIDSHAAQLQQESVSSADLATSGSSLQQEPRRLSKPEHQRMLYQAALRRHTALKASSFHPSDSTPEANVLLSLRDAAVIAWALKWFEQTPPLTVHVLSKIAHKLLNKSVEDGDEDQSQKPS